MCFATAAAIASIGSAVIGGIGAITEGEARANAAGQQAQMAAYQAQVARNNEIIANQQADAAIAAGQREAEAQSMKTGSRVARIRAAAAARGVEVGTGSEVDVEASERAMGKLDTETALSNAQMRAYGYRSRATSFRAESDLYGMSERNLYATASAARTGGYFKAFGTLLSGASQMPAGWFGGGTGSGGGSGSLTTGYASAGAGAV